MSRSVKVEVDRAVTPDGEYWHVHVVGPEIDACGLSRDPVRALAHAFESASRELYATVAGAADALRRAPP